MKLAIPLIMALTLCGCSWILVNDRVPTNSEPSQYLRCDSGSGAQYADFAIAGAAFATMIVVNARVEEKNPGDSRNFRTSEVNAAITTIVALPILLTYMASAITGLDWRDNCRAAKQQSKDLDLPHPNEKLKPLYSCRAAVENIRRITGLDQEEWRISETMMRSCQANATPEEVECIVRAETGEHLKVCQGLSNTQ